ncbi:type I restriction-modification system subunit M [Candidatus Nitrotoga sp. 1052]|uniref:type I restriction-modification system subunit M n=1 Tax=Candidatus Nitrotoga sp. 1052 TaxID=2886964 RepID=UPI001EF49C2C|nr:class I SAM-dependent DNA methyltransferase [Candidatus Nitrotoga sp. 1052]CAH1074569.1 Site-specific DNA-methyltransferase (adenine-specific) [Candidatus Nitrotoga sp. 1052]
MNKEQLKKLEADLWSAADKLRANSDLKSSEYATPVLGLIFLKFADNNYRRHETEIHAEFTKLKGTRREKKISDIAIEKCGFYLPDHARYEHLLNLPEEKNIAKALKEAMKAIEEYKPELEGVLPKDEYAALTRTDKTIPQQLLRTFADIPADTTGDLFGQIYEYFLSEFARSEGQKGGEFFTPRSVVRLMVEIIEPHGGKVFDPACGSGGMFVQSAQFIAEHRKELKGSESGVYVCGQEKTRDTVNLAKMNLAVNGLRGEIKQANTYYEDPYQSFGAFDYVLANPPFNVDDVSLSSVEKDKRFNTYGIPRNKSKVKKADEGKETVPNGNYLWISLFATSLKEKGRAALVMANSASDARHSEADIRKTLIEQNLIYAMLTLPSNMFYTVTLPATLWFFDKAKTDDKILFIDARNIFTQIDRAHREFSEEHIQNIAIISQLHKGRRDKFVQLIDRYFAAGMARLVENKTNVEPVATQLLEVLDDAGGKQAVGELVQQWAGLAKLKTRYEKYLQQNAAVISNTSTVIPSVCEESSAHYKISPVGRNDSSEINAINKAQQQLREAFDPFFVALHEGLKRLDKVVRQHEKQQAEQAHAEGKRGTTDRKTNALKGALEALHTEVKNAEIFYQHIHWLQERFPKAEYEDVTGLCKLANSTDLKEQDYSLNAGRYVGVVIEEDGKTEEEFIEELLAINDELAKLNKDSLNVGSAITSNIRSLLGDGS